MHNKIYHKNPDTGCYELQSHTDEDVFMPNLRVRIVMKDEDSDIEQTLQLTHSGHSLQRSSQRGIDRQRIEMAIRFGRCIHRQGLVFCILGKRDLPDAYAHMRDKLSGTVLVLSGDDDSIITCYRGKDPFKAVRRKDKELLRQRA